MDNTTTLIQDMAKQFMQVDDGMLMFGAMLSVLATMKEIYEGPKEIRNMIEDMVDDYENAMSNIVSMGDCFDEFLEALTYLSEDDTYIDKINDAMYTVSNRMASE